MRLCRPFFFVVFIAFGRRFNAIKHGLNGVECGLELGGRLCIFLLSLFGSEIVIEGGLVFLLILGHDRIELFLRKVLFVEFLFEVQKFEDGS